MTSFTPPTLAESEQLLAAFRQAMTEGLAGNGPLPMLPAAFLMPERLPKNCEIPVFDVGGTNIRSARIAFDAEGRATIHNLIRGTMPGTHADCSEADFYESLCEVLLPNVRPGEPLGFCFSYPVTTDGTLLFWTKHIRVPEVVGTNIRTGLEAALAERGCPHVRAVILNDTVAALLASYTQPETEPILTHVGFILGTGTNCAYNAQTNMVIKAPEYPPHRIIPINCETGNFNQLPLTDWDKVYAAASEQAAHSPWEACISGVHLEHLGTRILKAAAQEGLFSHPVAQLIRETPLFANQRLNAFCGEAALDEVNATFADRLQFRRLLQPMYARAAHFAAVNLAAAALAGAKDAEAQGNTTSKHIRLNIDGSTFWKTTAVPFVAIVRRELDRLLGERGYTYEITHIDEAPLLGAALACG